jgi:predicted component of type VI protein secretion system
MAITVKIMKRTPGGRPALYATRDFDVLPVSIGRDAACSICLEDPHKHMSRFHAEIQEDGGSYWMAVVSKVNPVMAEGRRYGPGTRLALRSGDSFELAEYEVQVMLPEPVAAAEKPAAKAPPPSADAEEPGSTQIHGTPQLDAAERLFNEATFFGADEPARPRMIPADAEDALPELTFIPPKRAAPAPAAAGAMSDALRLVLEGAGLPTKPLTAAESERMLRDCGAILGAAVEGIMMLLLARAEMRKAFGTEERSLVAPRDNNPLKRMSDPQEAMDFLLDPGERTDGLLDPVHAVRDACAELRMHELALMAGMRAAVQGALGRFDPSLIERAFENSRRGFSLGSRKAKLWELFVVQQDQLSREAQDDFNKVFGRDFMGAYEAHLKEVKGGG